MFLSPQRLVPCEQAGFPCVVEVRLFFEDRRAISSHPHAFALRAEVGWQSIHSVSRDRTVFRGGLAVFRHLADTGRFLKGLASG
jgi:hypothetical protein